MNIYTKRQGEMTSTHKKIYIQGKGTACDEADSEDSEEAHKANSGERIQMMSFTEQEHSPPISYIITTQDSRDQDHAEIISVDSATTREEMVRVLPPTDGVIRFVHINMGGISQRQGYTKYKLN